MRTKFGFITVLSPICLLIAGTLSASAGNALGIYGIDSEPGGAPSALWRLGTVQNHTITKLRLLGYKQIKIERGPHADRTVVACKHRHHVRLKINKTGHIGKLTYLGNCPKKRADNITTASVKAPQNLSLRAKALNQLAMSGYKKVKLYTNSEKLITATACRSDKRMRLDLGQNGQVIRKSRIGTCNTLRAGSIVTAALPASGANSPTPRQALKPLRAFLRSKGYNRMTFTDRTAPYYQVTACLKEKQMRIDMRASGYIYKVSRIGTCSSFAPLREADTMATAALAARTAAMTDANKKVAENSLRKSKNIRTMLMLSGYKRIKINSDGSGLTTATACQSKKLMRLDLGKDGKVIDKNRIGTCKTPYPVTMTVAAIQNNSALSRTAHGYEFPFKGFSKIVGSFPLADGVMTAALPTLAVSRPTRKQDLKPLRNYLRSKGYNRMVFTDRTAPFYQVTACSKEKQMRIDMRASGYITKVSRIGTCSYLAPQDNMVKPASREVSSIMSIEARDTDRKPAKIRQMLTMSGFQNVQISARGEAGYFAKACKAENLMAVDVNAIGHAVRFRRIGTCSQSDKGAKAIRIVNASHIMSDAVSMPELANRNDIYTCGSTFVSAIKAEQIQFRSGSTKIDPIAHDKLNRIADMMMNCNGNRVVIGGYTDSDGSKNANLRTAAKRAKAVMSYLMNRGVNPGQLSIRGYGESNPIAPNTSATNKALNRRVQFAAL